MKILIAVLACDNSYYNYLVDKGIRKTWGSRHYSDVEIVYYYGRPDTNCKEENNNIFVNIEDTFTNISKKNLKFFEYILKNKTFDFLYRVNASSYVNVSNLKQLIKNWKKTKVYSGLCSTYINEQNVGIPFVSGAAFCMTPDIVKLVLDNKEKINHNYIDDIGLGDLLIRQLNIIPFNLRRQDIFTLDEAKNQLDLSQTHYLMRGHGNTINNFKSYVEFMTAIDKKLNF